MEPPELHTHSFVVRIWRERLGPRPGQQTWRGHITHVGSGKRQYLRSLCDIVDYIVPYLEQMSLPAPRLLKLWGRVRRLVRPGRRP